jgi:hypothetical protein
MTDDQEERMLRLKPPLGAKIFSLYWMDGHGRVSGIDPSKSIRGMVSDLHLAPKRTDEEYAELKAECGEAWSRSNIEKGKAGIEAQGRKEAELRIKELEELAPKHTDEEYDKLYSHWARCVGEGECILEKQFDLEARIQELKAQADACPVCGTVRRVEELRAKERAKSHDDKPEG